eukprot:1948372-Rhodomonas_salina.5
MCAGSLSRRASARSEPCWARVSPAARCLPEHAPSLLARLPGTDILANGPTAVMSKSKLSLSRLSQVLVSFACFVPGVRC